MSKTKKGDFLEHVARTHPALHAKITSHPKFDATKHNSLHKVMRGLDGPMGLTDDECNDIMGSINSAADQHGKDYASDLMFGPDADEDEAKSDGAFIDDSEALSALEGELAPSVAPKKPARRKREEA
jgi:hypothetical protein